MNAGKLKESEINWAKKNGRDPLEFGQEWPDKSIFKAKTLDQIGGHWSGPKPKVHRA